MAAANFPGSQGTTRGSFQPATQITAGYFAWSTTCCIPSISYKALHSTLSFTVPNSGILMGPLKLNSNRMALAQPTLQMAAAYRSGLSVIALVIRMPPALVPQPDNLDGWVYPCFIRYSAQLLKSF